MSKGTKSQTLKSKMADEHPSPNTDMTSLLAELRQLRNELSEVKQQNLDIKKEMSSISDTLHQTLKEHSKQMERAKLEIADLKTTVVILQQQIASQEQESMKNHLEIVGLAERDNENLYHIVMTASHKIGVDLTESDIDEVVRVGARSRQTTKRSSQNNSLRPRPIVVKLTRKKKRDDVMNAAKTRRNVTSEGLVDGEPTRIFFNERLSKENRNLFREARTRASEHGFRYCWTRNGYIFVRKADNKPAIRISTHKDLEEHVGPAVQTAA
ncbi:uncharacterized protein LOC114362227 [Ostrinia furnacalis]|uniref:uncharacterized protein LOC114362227 n=1 Tax=Ostrinia furnacalis TaxID=93504 RepID=UPI00103C1FC9|nr:uncharacterized protein LOC114362227 [Ostrinia furnacalis]